MQPKYHELTSLKQKAFEPSLIVEVTKICDRQCPGCYTVNYVTQENSEILHKTSPDLFLNPSQLSHLLKNIGSSNLLESISIRGGEPTKHPQLDSILEIIHSFTIHVYLETHGRWLLGSENQPFVKALLKILQLRKTILKISFDSMHGLKDNSLEIIIQKLSVMNIAWKLAVTERFTDDFNSIKKRFPNISESKWIFQKKALLASELVQPKFGVINVNGKLVRRLSTYLSESY